MNYGEVPSPVSRIIYQNSDIVKISSDDMCFVKTLAIVKIWRRGILRSEGSVSPKHANTRLIRPSYDPTLLLKAKEWTKSLESRVESSSTRILSLLNKLAPSNRVKLQEQLYLISQENESNLKILVEKIFQKACIEKKFLSLWAELCVFLVDKYKCTHGSQNNQFRSELLLMSQNMFEELGKGIEFQGLQKKRIIGNLSFVGELFKHRVIPKSTIANCVKSLLAKHHDEDSIEGAMALIMVAGRMMYRLKKDFQDILNRAKEIEETSGVPSRIKYLLLVLDI